MPVKIILIVFFVCLALYWMRANLGAKQTAWGRLGMVAFCLAAIVAVALPNLTTRAAHVIGVGRGADLLMYMLVVVFLLSQVTNAKHRNEQQRKLTRLAREIAINKALIDDTEQSPTLSEPQAGLPQSEPEVPMQVPQLTSKGLQSDE